MSGGEERRGEERRGEERRGEERRGEERRGEERRGEERRGEGVSMILFTDWVYSKGGFYTPGQTSGRQYQTCVSLPSDAHQTSELALVPAERSQSLE